MAPDTPKRQLGQQEPTVPLPQGYVPLWLGKGRSEFGFCILSQIILWFNTHWIDGRIHPCIADIGPCKPCKDGWRGRPKGFVGAMRADTGGRYLLQVTPSVFTSCTILKLKKLDLRGVCVIVRRDGDTKQARWNWKAIERVPFRELPPTPDVLCALEQLWGLDVRRLNACPPPDGDVTPMLRAYRRESRRFL